MSHEKSIGIMGKHVFAFTDNLEFSAKLIGGSSFLAGTALFLFALIKPFKDLFIVGLYFTAIAFIINTIVFLSLLISASIFFHKRQILLKTAAMLLLNIPIVFIYLLIIISYAPTF